MSFTKTIIFFPGFLKSSDDFEYTESGKKIGITSCINKRANVHKVSLTKDDYLKPIDEILDEVMKEVFDKFKSKKIILVGHSFGAFYVLRCVELYKNRIDGILLIDPTFRDHSYRSKLFLKLDEYKKKEDWDRNILTQCKLDRFYDLTNGENIGCNLEIVVMINVTNEDDKTDKIKYYKDLIKDFGKEKSQLVIYNNLSHMIHYKRSADVIKIINDML